MTDTKKATWLAVFLALCTASVKPVAAQPAAQNPAAVQVIEAFNATLVGVLKDSATLGYKGRLERMRPALEESFDLDFMSAKAVGRYWDKMNEEERKKWRSTFAHFMGANYASRLNEFKDQKFEVVSTEAAANDTTIVETKVTVPGQDDVQLSYRMRETPKGWRIIDIYYNGTVSEIALRRADYSAVLKKDGFAALIASVSQKIADMEAGKTA